MRVVQQEVNMCVTVSQFLFVQIKTQPWSFNLKLKKQYQNFVSVPFRLQDLFQQEKGRKRLSVPPSPGRHRQTATDDSKVSKNTL